MCVGTVEKGLLGPISPSQNVVREAVSEAVRLAPIRLPPAEKAPSEGLTPRDRCARRKRARRTSTSDAVGKLQYDSGQAMKALSNVPYVNIAAVRPEERLRGGCQVGRAVGLFNHDLVTTIWPLAAISARLALRVSEESLFV
ncbi:hypothetical protein HAX54_051962 [Datura stramonium]|uniref:Uncharacterized protein n=1 Tax=Datura stramonium TaxID=4076 RepID=A0ABS8SZ99_DATST|nr:hypothetical protein [Datura stramonium]